MKEQKEVIIVGAGVSGLIAALELEAKGYRPVVVEKSGEAGGRLKTMLHEDWPLDMGFQVLLTAYPSVREYIDLDALDPVYFRPGAAVYQNGRMRMLGDPLRDPTLAIPTALNPHLGLRDKWLTFRLRSELRRTSIEDIFSEPEQATGAWLKSYGFSESAIDYFFRPFFSGIFLEPNLETGSRMFRFVYKMFTEGKAVVPRAGIAHVPAQLKSRLRNSRFRFHTPVEAVRERAVLLTDGTELEASAVVLACSPEGIRLEWEGASEDIVPIRWRRVRVAYAWVAGPVPHPGFIGLTATRSMVNNWSEVPVPRVLGDNPEKRLLSITLLEPEPQGREGLFRSLSAEMKAIAGIELLGLAEVFTIEQALPVISDLNDRYDSRLPGTDRVFTCGDYRSFPSLHAAMASGKAVALEVDRLLSGEA